MRNFVCVDMGASGTRYVSDNCNICVLPNNMVFVGLEEDVDLKPYNNNIENALDIAIYKEGPSEIFPVRALMGKLAERYSASNVRPSVMQNKKEQKINYVSAIASVAVKALNGEIGDKTKLYLALPPVEVKDARKEMADRLVGKYRVVFDKLGRTVEFEVTQLLCFEEAYMAIMAYFFELNGAVRNEAKEFANGNVLSMDIGASTTDMSVVSDMKYLEKSGKTYKTGGNIAREYIADAVREKFGYDITDAQAEVVMAEGRLQTGNTYVDMSESVNNAKKLFAQQITTQIPGYFRSVNIPIQSIRAIVVSGGGSMRSEYIDSNGQTVVTTEPMYKFITDELKEVCPGVEIVEFRDNPRMANIKGLYIRAMVEAKIEASEEAKAQANNVAVAAGATGVNMVQQ